MKKTVIVSLLVVIGLLPIECFGQGTFQNLGFESARIVPVLGDPYGRVDFAQAFPGWTGYVGTGTQDRVLFNKVFLDTSSGISLINLGWNRGAVLSGNYSAVLQAGDNSWSTGMTRVNTTLEQTGTVPLGTQSLLFKTDVPRLESFSVALNGQSLGLTSFGAGLWGADVRAWSGQTATLSFTLFSERHVGNRAIILDSIEFSPLAVPEPEACSLVVFGLGAVFAFKKFW